MSVTEKEVGRFFEKLPKAELGVNLYIKRDDFTGMNLFG